MAKGRVLIVDDEKAAGEGLRDLLAAEGYETVAEPDGVAGLKRVEEFLPSVVITDVLMPRMDGFGLLQAIRNDPRLSTLPVILMTSRADPEDVRKGLDLGASAYITKQKFDQRELLATIGQML